ncbi:hypothetical protein [Pseudoduganella sp. OTU4001]|uniref:hypothetical protein n=1 Tax=Pseudoduganella sp. OTU4001 TaxID=3043854 RepID=UPI00313BA2E7
MSTINKGRSLEQQTHHSTSSIGTYGAGSTGEGKLSRQQEGNQQSAGRTDDLLSGGVDETESEHGFQTGPQYRQGEQPENTTQKLRRSER